MTRFRERLSAQDSVLYFTTDLQHNRACKRHTLTVLLDITKAFDSVRPDVVLNALQAIELQQEILHFLNRYLSDRRFCVKLESTLSTSRPLLSGLLQGIVLSSILFNVVMAHLLSAVPRSEPQVSCTVYAADVCLWAVNDNTVPLRRAVEQALNIVSITMAEVGLHISREKSCFRYIFLEPAVPGDKSL